MSQDRNFHIKSRRALRLATRGSLAVLAALAIAMPTVAQTDLGVFSIGAEHRLQGSVDPAVTAGNGFSGEYHDVASGNANFALSISRDFIAANDPTGTFTSPHIDHPFGPGDNEIGDQIMGVTTTIQNYLGDDFANYVGPNNDLPGSLFLYRGFLNVRPEFDLFGGNGTIDINFGIGNGEGFSFFLGGTEAGLFDGELVFENTIRDARFETYGQTISFAEEGLYKIEFMAAFPTSGGWELHSSIVGEAGEADATGAGVYAGALGFLDLQDNPLQIFGLLPTAVVFRELPEDTGGGGGGGGGVIPAPAALPAGLALLTAMGLSRRRRR